MAKLWRPPRASATCCPDMCSPAQPHPSPCGPASSPHSINYSTWSPPCGSIHIPDVTHTEPPGQSYGERHCSTVQPQPQPCAPMCSEHSLCSLTRPLTQVPTPKRLSHSRFLHGLPHGLSQRPYIGPQSPPNSHRPYAPLPHTLRCTVHLKFATIAP